MADKNITLLKSYVTRRSNIDRDIERMIQDMRFLERYSWAQIGEVLGVSRQAAQQKYGWLTE